MRTRSKLLCTALLTASSCALALGAGVAEAAPPTTTPAGAGELHGRRRRHADRHRLEDEGPPPVAARRERLHRREPDPARAAHRRPGRARSCRCRRRRSPRRPSRRSAGGRRHDGGAPPQPGAGPRRRRPTRSSPATTSTASPGASPSPFNGLLQANNLTATSAILPGRQLTIPAGATTTPAATNAAATAAAAAATTTAPAATTTTAPKIAKPIAAPKLDIAPTGNAQIDAVLAFAKAQLGKPYVFAAAGPDTYDCSGLTMAAYAQVGVQLIPQSGMQSTQGTAVDFLNAPILPGDLVFTAGSATPGVISHVGIAISPTLWIQATRPGRVGQRRDRSRPSRRSSPCAATSADVRPGRRVADDPVGERVTADARSPSRRRSG